MKSSNDFYLKNYCTTYNFKYIFEFISLKPLIISSIVLSLFIIQYYFTLTPLWLIELQNNAVYKQITGFLLVAYVFVQWRLAYRRSKGQKINNKLRDEHRVYGVCAPIFYYLHSVDIGFAYQALLSIAFLMNCLVGSCNPVTLKIRYRFYYPIWLFFHILLSVFIIPLSLYHLYIVYAY